MGRTRLVTAWLSGCSGCHLSVLDLDDRPVDLAPAIDIVYGPLVDAKEYPENVGVALVESAVGATEHQGPHARESARDGASQGIATTTLRAAIGDIPLDDVLAKRDKINDVLRVKLDEVTERWGVKVTTVEIREILPPQ